VIVGGLARRAGLLVPEFVTAEIDPVLGAAERDPEVRELITVSAVVNLGVGFPRVRSATRRRGRGARTTGWPPTLCGSMRSRQTSIAPRATPTCCSGTTGCG